MQCASPIGYRNKNTHERGSIDAFEINKGLEQ